MLVGPAVVGDAMARAPTFGFPLVVGAVFTIYAAIVVARIFAAWRRADGTSA